MDYSKSKLIILAIISYEVMGFLAWKIPHISIFLVCVASTWAYFYIKKSKSYGIELIFTQAMLDPMGRILAIESISMRMILFTLILITFISKNSGSIKELKKSCALWFQKSMLIFYAFLIIGLFSSWAQQLPILQIFNDANGYLFFLLIPVAQKISPKQWLQWVYIALWWLIIKTLALFTWLSHIPKPFFMTDIYIFLRDTRVAEMTPKSGQGVRIFLQSHIFTACALLGLVIEKKRIQNLLSPKAYKLLFIGSTATLIISLSRSLWLATAVILAGIILDKIWKYDKPVQILKDLLGSTMYAVVLVVILFMLPFGTVGTFNDLTQLIQGRTELTKETAALSRWKMLPHIMSTINTHPITGSGFGSLIKIPDTKNNHIMKPQVEWGWLDILIKTGAIGLALFVAFLISLVLISNNKKNLLIGVIFLTLIHMFTPYLNHPLGITLLMMLMSMYGHTGMPYPRINS